ncbi:hypothetical protein ACFC06_02360 [Nocardia sp. NPDC056064]|uniref:hypothetical protein n=1 Tax=Nocardia sp. NPDC056064 TaxID=3345701 RepID=UPI0035DE9F69
MSIEYVTDPADPAAIGDPAVICWPDPSPLDTWWTEVMDGVVTGAPLDSSHSLME